MSITTEAQVVYDNVSSIRDELENVRRRMNELTRLADNVVRKNPLPQEFIGIVKDYRYTTRDFNGNFATPLHKLFLDCGAGLWLYSQNTSPQFEAVIIGMEMPEVTSMRNALVDAVVRVRREKANNQLVFAEFIAKKALDLPDSRGQVLYQGARVLHPDYPGIVESESRADGVFNLLLDDQTVRSVFAKDTVRADS